MSPFKIHSPTPGPHTLEVRAVNRSGATETTPAKASWSSVEPVHNLCEEIKKDTTIGPEYAAVYEMKA